MSDFKCLYPPCHTTKGKHPGHYSRGLCKVHYMVAFQLVRTKQTTWKELVENKRCLSNQKSLMTGVEEWFLSVNSH